MLAWDMSNDTVVLAPAGYLVDSTLGSDPERPWRLIQGLAAKGIRVVAIARTVNQAQAWGPSAIVRLVPGRMPASPTGRLLDRIRLYLFARKIAIDEASRGPLLAVHHMGPCSRMSPSTLR